MTTPTEFEVPPPAPEDVAGRLQEVLSSREDATPEPKFQRNVKQDFKYFCEVEHRRFGTNRIDKLRTQITKSAYWEREAQILKSKLADVHLESLLLKFAMDGKLTTDTWRKVRKYYAHRLKRNGLSAEQLRETRLSINEQCYWEPEAEVLRSTADRLEIDQQKKHVKARRRHLTQAKRSARRAPAKSTESEGVSTRTRSKTGC